MSIFKNSKGSHRVNNFAVVDTLRLFNLKERRPSKIAMHSTKSARIGEIIAAVSIDSETVSIILFTNSK